MKETTAETTIEIVVYCPYCHNYQNRFYDLHDQLDSDGPRAEGIDKEMDCVYCKKTFIVTDIKY